MRLRASFGGGRVGLRHEVLLVGYVLRVILILALRQVDHWGKCGHRSALTLRRHAVQAVLVRSVVCRGLVVFFAIMVSRGQETSLGLIAWLRFVRQ